MQKALFFLLFLPLTAFAQLFPYDVSFNNTGYSLNNIASNDFGTSLNLLNDGKILVSGTTDDWSTTSITLFLMKFHTNGQLDSTFGTNGKLLITNYDAPWNCMTRIKSDGKIIIVYNGDLGLACQRFLPNGAIDSTFGTNGIFEFPPNNPVYDDLYAADVDLQLDGKMVVTVSDFSGSPNILLFRLNVDGTLDNTFGNSSTHLATSSSDAFFNSKESLITNNNKIVCVSGSEGSTAYPNSILIRRFNTNGSIDNSFGTNGRIRINDGNSNIRLHNLGSKFYVSYRDVASPSQGKVVAFYQNGSLDNNFGQNGVLTFPYKNINDIEGDANDNIIITAQGEEVNNQRPMILARYDANGNLDSTFAQNGFYSNPLSTSHITYAHQIAIDNSGSIVAVGNSQGLFTFGFDVFVAKFIPNLSVNTRAIQTSSLQPKIYPNPVQNQLILQYNLEEKTDLLIELYDVSGKRIKVLSNQNELRGKHQKEWNIEALQTGVYFLRLESDNENVTLKMIKK